MNNQYFIKEIQKCFDVLNCFLKSKNGVTEDPFFIRENKTGLINIGYKPIKEHIDKPFFSDEIIPNEYASLERASLVQFVIFEGCKEYGCYKEVPMCGAPEENNDAFFKFTFHDTEYTYKIWSKR